MGMANFLSSGRKIYLSDSESGELTIPQRSARRWRTSKNEGMIPMTPITSWREIFTLIFLIVDECLSHSMNGLYLARLVSLKAAIPRVLEIGGKYGLQFLSPPSV